MSDGDGDDQKKAAESEIDFDHAQFDAPVTVACGVCKQAFAGEYYSVNGHGVCAQCLTQLRAAQSSSFFKALGLGIAAGVVGALVYYAIRSLTGYDLALITIVVGIAVGIAVRRGAGGSRSWVYRALAVGITWVAMCATYVPEVLKGLNPDGSPTHAGHVIFAAVLAQIVPFLLIAEGQVLGVLIFAFGIWEAWRRSAAAPFVVEGPFQPAAAPTVVPAAEPAVPEPSA